MKDEMLCTSLAKIFMPPVAGFSFAAGGDKPLSPATPGVTEVIKLPTLPYPPNALAPYISEKTIGFHYGKHHQTYVDNINKLISGTPLMDLTLVKIICETTGLPDKAGIFNNSAQVWNHNFYWKSMKPGGGGRPAGRLMNMIEKSFGSFENFSIEFLNMALSQFGSGWVWLVQDGEQLKIIKTSNADTPVARNQNALLTCDVWEHAYYLDYQNLRKDYVLIFLNHLVNWDFADSLLK